MIQEILTYAIMGSAVLLTIIKFGKKLAPRKVKKHASASKKTTSPTHNCGECSAECQLRDFPSCLVEKDKEGNALMEKKSKFFQS